MNPVMSRIDSTVRKTPAGYPEMPGYQVGQGTAMGQTTMPTYPAAPAYGQRETQSLPPQVDMEHFEQTYAAPSADAVDRGQVTMDDIIVRTGILFALVVAAAAVGWYLMATMPAIGAMVAMAGALVALVLAFINAFKSKPSPILIMAYAIGEGLFLGAISMIFNNAIAGIVLQAVVATFIVFAVTLALYSMRVVRNSPALTRFTLIGLISVMLFFLASWGLSLFLGFSLTQVTVFGLPLGMVVGIVCIVLAITSLIMDFDVCERAVASGAPRVYAWMCAFGLMVTLIWLYTSILRVLSYFYGQD